MCGCIATAMAKACLGACPKLGVINGDNGLCSEDGDGRKGTRHRRHKAKLCILVFSPSESCRGLSCVPKTAACRRPARMRPPGQPRWRRRSAPRAPGDGLTWSSALAARSSRPQRPTPSPRSAAVLFLCDEHPVAVLCCGTDDGVASRVLRFSRLASTLLPQAWRSRSRSSSGRYPLYRARFMRISYGRSRLQMCASCFVLMRQHDGTIGSGHGAARTRQEAGHLGRYGARRSCELYGSYLRSCQCPRYRTATEAARRMGVCSVHECVWGRLWVR